LHAPAPEHRRERAAPNQILFVAAGGQGDPAPIRPRDSPPRADTESHSLLLLSDERRKHLTGKTTTRESLKEPPQEPENNAKDLERRNHTQSEKPSEKIIAGFPISMQDYP
jgi:hypothetical protein